MPRVEWAALSGDEVEAVVSNLLYNEFPTATRIRPSQGDYGIDVLIPSSPNRAIFDIYQIKKFATNLGDSEKRQIKSSFRRLLIGLVRRGIPVGDWYLVMPLDPTIENRLDWFNAMPNDVIQAMFSDGELALADQEREQILNWLNHDGRIIEWKGNLFCEALASKYWFVPDYYLHGGNERVRAAVSDVAVILHRDLTLPEEHPKDATSILTPSEVADHLARLQRALDGDPHFRYGVSFDPRRPQLTAEPGLVAATQEVAPDGSCLTFKIFQRSNESLNERPIPIRLNFQVTEESFQAFELWRKYGKPVTLPAEMDANLPGGLGGKISNGTITITPADNDPHESRYRVVTPTGNVAGEVTFRMVSATGPDGTGRWLSGTDPSGAVSIDALVSATDRKFKAQFKVNDITDRDPTAAAPALEFMAALDSPNRLQVAAKYGPFFDIEQLPENREKLPDLIARFVRALAVFQTRTAEQLAIPDLSAMTIADVHRVIDSAVLIQGQVIIKTWDGFSVPSVNPGVHLDPDGHYQISILRPLRLKIAEREISVGTVETVALSAKVVTHSDGSLSILPATNNTAHERFAEEEPMPSGGELPVRWREVPRL
ncbi:hypothetical protein ACFYO5_25290 [Streptomyces sp. NPDC006259]|uniref:hypothetical protein n=1 Tax=Streptomyces sp. NPDC006259 TaxID=3364740 RepID=UPI0036BEB8F5